MFRGTLDDFWGLVRRRGGAPKPSEGIVARRDSQDQRMKEALARWSRELSRPELLAQPPAEPISYLAQPQPLAPELAAPEMPPLIPPPEGPTDERPPHPTHDEDQPEPPPTTRPAVVDYYEILQISRNADAETIHRVYKIMASRFHPDNPQTGDVEKFMALQCAYEALSDPVERAHYDALHPAYEAPPLPIFELKDFVEGIDGEQNRRLGVLSLLYHRRRLNQDSPGLSLLELERRMSFPREYLEFTLWYLRSKGYVQFLDHNSDYGVTAAGVDYVEQHSCTNKVIRELLTAGSSAKAGDSAQSPQQVSPMMPPQPMRPSPRPRRRKHTVAGRAVARG
jgi:hypothetical protein